MEISLLFVKILGIYMVVSGLFLVVRGKTVPMLLKDFFEHRATMYLAGFILILVGGVLTISKPANQVWVEILGYLVLLKGVAYILAPEMFFRFTMQRFKPFLAVGGVLIIIIGILLYRI